MQQLIAMTRKEFLIWVQRPGSWILIFVVPFLFIWIVQAVFGSTGTPVVTLFAVNQDKGQPSERVMTALQQSANLKIELLKTREEADRRVGSGERMAAVIIPPGFGQALSSADGAKIEIIVDPARSEQASIVTGLVNAALSPLIVDAEVSRGVESGVSQAMQGLGGQNESLKKFFTAAMKGVVSSQVQEALDNPQVSLDAQPYEASQTPARRPSLLDYLVPGYSLMFVFFLIGNLAVTVVEERQMGTLRRLLVSPIPRSRILLGKMLPYFLIAVVQFTVILLVSKVIFGIDLGSDPVRSGLALGIIILASSAAMVGLGILIAALSESEDQADGLAIVVVLAMAVISGAMFPSISIPGLQMVTPHYWSMQGFVNVLARGQGIEGVLRPAGVLLTMAAVFFTAGAIRFRFE